MAELSIVITTSNSMKGKKNSLELMLFSIERQIVDKQLLEIIFVDNGSRDNTLPFIQNWISSNYCSYCNIQLLNNQGPANRSKSRNTGVENASGEKILFMDDDTVIYKQETLDILIKRVYKKNTFFCGAQRYWTIAGWEFDRVKRHLAAQVPIDDIALLPQGISRETGFRDLQEFSFIGNFGGMMKKDFIDAGGFDAIRFPGRQEDVDLMYRLLMKGFAFQHLSQEIKVIHLNHPIVGEKANERIYWLNEFRKKELEEGYYFCINHLFGVYEDHDENHPVLKMIKE